MPQAGNVQKQLGTPRLMQQMRQAAAIVFALIIVCADAEDTY